MQELMKADELRDRYKGAQKALFDRTFTERWDDIVNEILWSAQHGGVKAERNWCIPFTHMSREKTEEILLDIGTQLNMLGYTYEHRMGTRTVFVKITW